MTNNTSTEVATQNDRGIYKEGAASAFTPQQRDELRALMNAGDASDADINMLLTVAQRTGLDPWTKQIYLVGRKTKTAGYRGEPDVYETKWTVQAGIDGFREATRRYAQELGESVDLGRAIWYDHEGNQRPFWLKAWGNPAAAEITVRVGNSAATHVVTWDEYCQTTKKGDPNSMWKQYGPTMLAKCAEAGAHRKICSLTAGVYVPEEMPIQVEATRVDQPQAPRKPATTQLVEKLSAPKAAPAEIEAAKAAENHLFDELLAAVANATSAKDLELVSTEATKLTDEASKKILRNEWAKKSKELGGNATGK